jgi:hypothetical protein
VYEWTRLDHTNAKDKALIEEYFNAREEDVSVAEGRIVRNFKFFK